MLILLSVFFFNHGFIFRWEKRGDIVLKCLFCTWQWPIKRIDIQMTIVTIYLCKIPRIAILKFQVKWPYGKDRTITYIYIYLFPFSWCRGACELCDHGSAMWTLRVYELLFCWWQVSAHLTPFCQTGGQKRPHSHMHTKYETAPDHYAIFWRRPHAVTYSMIAEEMTIVAQKEKNQQY